MASTVQNIVAAAGTVAAFTLAADAQTTLRVFYFEDFETVDLGDALDEDVTSVDLDVDGDGAVDFDLDPDGDGVADVWAGAAGFNALGFAVDTPANPNLPNQLNLGVEEWREWALTNSAWWAFDVDDQDRSEFALGLAGASTVAVADPDEWDDISAPFTDPVTGITTQESPENLTLWTSTLTTPEIALPVGATEIVVDFNLSWRDEDSQAAFVRAQFTDGFGNPVGGEVTLLSASSDSASSDFLNDFPNANFRVLVADAPTDTNIGPDVFPNGDTLLVPVGAAGVELSFGVENAANDWWFAIDNIALLAESAGGPIIQPGSFVINSQFINETVTPQLNLSRAVEAESYTVEISDSEDFSNVLGTVTVPQPPEGVLSIPVGVPAGVVNTGTFFARASATNVLGTTSSLNTASFIVVNQNIGDVNGDGALDIFDVLEVILIIDAEG